MSGLVITGGDPRIVATRAEIDRASNLVGLAQSRLLGEVQPWDFLNDPIHRVIFAVQLPAILIQLEKLRWACTQAADQYESAEAVVAERVHWVSQLVAGHPLLDKLIPKLWLEKAGVAMFGSILATQFIGQDTSKMLAREFVDVYPALTGLTSSNGNSSRAGASAFLGQLQQSDIAKPGHATLINQRQWPKATSPATLGDFASRVAKVHRQNEATIMIERYRDHAKRLFVVYIPGTREKTFLPTGDPFDLTDGAELLAHPNQAASQQAVLDAIQREGITPEDKVVLVGYSQGGTIAADIAAGGHGVKASALFTLGSPIAQVHLPKLLPVVSLEHTNDVVPALAGAVNPLTNNWCTVERTVDLAPGEIGLNAHRVGEYVQTAEAADKSANVGVRRVTKEITDLFKGYHFIEATGYEYARG